MRKSTLRLIVTMIVGIVCIMAMTVSSFADVKEVVNDNDLIITDKANLLNESQEQAIRGQLAELCEYGDAIVYTIDENSNSTEYAADQKLREYGNDGMVFVIDMDNREIYLFTTYNTLTKGKCYSITDNVFSYASNGDYYSCISVALSQSKSVLQGERIAEPMKYINNALFAIIIAMIITFIWLAATARKKKATAVEMTAAGVSDIMLNNKNLTITGTRVVHHEISDSGGGGGSFGGGGGGGGFSGGGGGHGGGHSF